MKAIVFFIILWLLTTNTIIAQSVYPLALQRGSIMANGNVDFGFGNAKYKYSSQTMDSKIHSFNINPLFGLFVSDGIVLGISLDYSNEVEKEDTNGVKIESRRTSFMAGPYARYYTKSGMFFMSEISFGSEIIKYDYSNVLEGENKNNKSSWKLGIGYAAFLNQHIALEPSLIYRAYSNKEEDNDSSFTYSSGEFVIGLGISIYLFKERELLN